MNEEREQPLSKTRRKQLAKEVESLADRLANLPDNQFAQLKLSEELREEADLARATRGRGSQRRQIKHFAAMLRKRDEELQSVAEQLLGLDQVARTEKRQFHRLEELRDRLCAANSFAEAFDELMLLCPEIDGKAISRLARSVQLHSDRRASREIFRRLRDELSRQEKSEQ